MMTSKSTSTKTAGRTTTSPTRSTTQTKVVSNRVATTSGNSRTTFPSSELNKWLRTRTYWNHEEWSHLLSDLRQGGYSYYTETESGRTEIGNYLETHRSR